MFIAFVEDQTFTLNETSVCKSEKKKKRKSERDLNERYILDTIFNENLIKRAEADLHPYTSKITVAPVKITHTKAIHVD